MRTFVVWIIDHLLAQFSAWVHPDQAARWQQIKRQSQELDAAEAELAQKDAELQKRLAESEKRNAERQAKIDEDDRAIAADEQKLAERKKQIADELAKTEADIDARPDTDRIDRPLPGTGSESH